jgi:hypothetical protein
MTPGETLDEVLREAARVRVAKPGTGDVLLEVTDPAALCQLRDALAVAETTDGYCMCHGDLTFAFFTPDGQPSAVVGFHHASSLRWSGWDGDALLRDGDRVLHWLAAQGLDDPPAVRRAELPEQESWLAAAPPAVRDLLDLAVAATTGGGVLPPGVPALIIRRLAEAVPDPVARAAALLSWYGSGSGRCSGYPLHEALPEPALAEIPLAHLLAVLDAAPADARIDAGAVRHLCGWQSRRHQAADIAALPGDVRERLLAVARESGDDDKRRRAERWLGDERRSR